MKFLKNKWLWVMFLAAAALAGGGTYSGQVQQIILMLLGSA